MRLNSTLSLKYLSFHDFPSNFEQQSKVTPKLSSKELAVTTEVTMPFSEGELWSDRTLIIGRMILRNFGKIWYLSQCLFFIWFCPWIVLHSLQSRFLVWITFVWKMLELISTSWLSKTKRSYPVSDQPERAYTYCWCNSAEAHWQTDV